MSTNPDIHYQKAEAAYLEAETVQEKIKTLRTMISLAPSHKSSEGLRKQLKTRLAKLNELKEKASKSKKSGYNKFSIKKEGSATVVILGIPNSGKSTLLKSLTNADVKVAPYPYTTIIPEQGILDYEGIKIQIVELPAIQENMENTEYGLALMSIVRNSDLVLILKVKDSDVLLIKKELKEAGLTNKTLIISRKDNPEKIKSLIWNNLNLIKVYTKQPGKPKDFPPVAFKKNSTVELLAKRIHKDFANKFRYAKITGNSAKFPNQKVGLTHKLKDNDIVELYIK